MDVAPTTDLHFLTIADAAALIAGKKLTPVELTRALLDRATALDPQLDAYLRPMPDHALAQARTAEREIMAGSPRGPLHGIPYGAKDVFATAGVPTTGHSRAYADLVPTADATTVARLGQAGAVLLGKLATHEGAHGGPSFDLAWPPARNPWNRAHFTGGSSSGSGAGVAAGLMPLALGTDTGGSIRNPAALCGLVGLKPTYGVVSRHGVMPNSFSYDTAGPLTWTVEDCALVMQAIAGHDPADPASARQAVPDYRAALTGDIRGLRIGVVRHFYETDIAVPDALKTALEAAWDVLRHLGATLEDVHLRPAQEYYDVKLVGAEAELYAVHEKTLCADPKKFGDDFLGRSLAAIMISGPDLVRAQRLRRRMIAEMAPLYEKYDVLVTAGPGPAPKLDAWRTIMFWQRPNITTAFNVTGQPALVQCCGFTDAGLPLSLQIAGRPFEDATVLRVAHAYEMATPWRGRRPILDPAASFSTALPPVPDVPRSDLSADRRAEIAARCAGAGLVNLTPRLFEQLCATVPYIEEMIGRLRAMDTGFDHEPASIFTFPTDPESSLWG